MSKKFVLIPLRVFQNLCSSTKKSGDKIYGVIKEYSENETKKSTKKRCYLITQRYNLLILFQKTRRKTET